MSGRRFSPETKDRLEREIGMQARGDVSALARSTS